MKAFYSIVILALITVMYQNCGEMNASKDQVNPKLCAGELGNTTSLRIPPEYFIAVNSSSGSEIIGREEIVYSGPLLLSVKDLNFNEPYQGIATWSIYKDLELISQVNQGSIDFVINATNTCEHYRVVAEVTETDSCGGSTNTYAPELRIRTSACNPTITPTPTPTITPTPTPAPEERYIPTIDAPSVAYCNQNQIPFRMHCSSLGFSSMKCYPRDDLNPGNYGYNGLYAGYLCYNN